MLEILRLADERELSVFLACRADGLSTFEETREAILKVFPELDISGDNINIKNVPYQILDTRYQILLCNFGAPHQEVFINSLKDDKIRLAMGVGGSFDFLTGKVKRAPVFLRQIGLEWLWRLILQPGRIKRIFRAVIVFPIKVIFSR
jgi:N-acetylglucosaminyldiphosphoundecaprenol N-acetyl-beta-D-mannosaminyltransferase